MIATIRDGLTRAEALVAERNATLGEWTEEIARLRAGLAHAEALAFERTAKLNRIRAFWLWKTYKLLMRSS